MSIIPPKLSKGDTIRIIAPARSLGILSEDTRRYADAYLTEVLGLKIQFSRHSSEMDQFRSSSIEHRLEDLHGAFADPSVRAILTVIGGYNSNQLLDYIDWDLIKKHPKILSGFSDITALQNAIYAKTGLVAYSGPHYTTFGQKQFDQFTADYLRACLFQKKPFVLKPSAAWTDDQWFLDQDARSPVANPGHHVLQVGEGEGTIIGGNLCTLNLLQGTDYMPKDKEIVLFIEDDEESYAEVFDRDLQSLLHSLQVTSTIKALVIGRFQRASEMSLATLMAIIKSKRALKGVPVVSNVDFGHTDPKITFPIGGRAMISCTADRAEITILRH